MTDQETRCGECGGPLIEASFPEAPNLTAKCVDCGTRHGSVDPILVLHARLAHIAAREGGPMFMGWPDRWWEAHTRRCVNDHVSTRVLKSEELGRDACLACHGPVALTFPEDQDGPLVAP